MERRGRVDARSTSWEPADAVQAIVRARARGITESLLGRFHRDRKRVQRECLQRGQPEACVSETQDLATRLIRDCSRRLVDELVGLVTDARGSVPAPARLWVLRRADEHIASMATGLQEQLHALRVEFDVWSGELGEVSVVVAQERRYRAQRLRAAP